MSSSLRAAFVIATTIASFTAIARAQLISRQITSSTFDATRAELTRRLDSLQRVDPSAGKKNDRRERQEEIDALKSRLQNGDLQVGDRFLIDYGDPTRRADTVLVRDSANIALLNWPSASVQGVLNSELQGAVEKYVSRFVREPRLRVYPLTRLTFVGGFGRPGVYAVDPKRPLSDAITNAGGTGSNTKGEEIEVYRGKRRLLDQKRIASAVQAGLTVEQLGIQSGDQVRVPIPQPQRNWRLTVQPVLLGVSVLTALLAIIRASYNP